ncbi:MAG: hypothetical protein WAX36_01430, partial [Ruminococcus bromii]
LRQVLTIERYNMKLNLPKNQKYYHWTVIDLLASSASKRYKYEFNNTSGEDATVLQKYVVGSDR